MFVFQWRPHVAWLRSVSRLCWASLTAGVVSIYLFLTPFVMIGMHGYSPKVLPALLVAWLSTGFFGIIAIGSGFLSQWRLRPGERHSMVFSVLGGALGLTSTLLSFFVLAGMAWQFLAKL